MVFENLRLIRKIFGIFSTMSRLAPKEPESKKVVPAKFVYWSFVAGKSQWNLTGKSNWAELWQEQHIFWWKNSDFVQKECLKEILEKKYWFLLYYLFGFAIRLVLEELILGFLHPWACFWQFFVVLKL